MPLTDYHAKRDFDQTPEPTGGQGSGPLRFVVQKHDASRLHYDFRLEMDGVLKSWAVPKGPSLNPQDKHLAMMTEDHPYDYRTFEGIIPKGNYGAGSVIVWDEGTYEPLVWDEKTGETLKLSRQEQDKAARHGVHAGHLTFLLHGHKLNGELALIKMQHADEENAWLLVKAHKDKFVSEDDVTKQNRSVITKRTVEEVAAGKPETKLELDLEGAPKAKFPTNFEPMLATLAEKPFDDPNWLYEIKWDGYRIMAEIHPSAVTLHSRHGQNYTERFKPVADELRGLQVPAVIDGEMTVVDSEGRPSFQALQNYLRTGQGHLLYHTFDLLYLDGHDLTVLPLEKRKELLRRILPQGPHLRYSDHVAEQGIALLTSARKQGLEGIIAKLASAPYRGGLRSRQWLKLKTHHRQEAVIAGYTAPRGGRQHFGALVLGLYQDGHLIYAGHTGSGFSDDVLAGLYKRFQPLRTDHSPIQPPPVTNEPATWLKPQLVCEVEFSEWTEDGSMRHPIFVGLREDKPASEVVREKATPKPQEEAKMGAASQKGAAEHVSPRRPQGETRAQQNPADSTPTITHPDKLYWPKEHITKGDLIRYYEQVAPLLLPYLRDRPESLNRFPDGITGPSFYHKDLEDHPAWVKTVPIHSESADKDIHFLICNNAETLAYMVNLGCIDINPWNSRLHHLDNPDWCVIDLDPEGVGFESVVEVARTVHAVLDELGLASFPKTSGATGIHIFLPMGARYTYDQVRLLAELLVRLVHERLPKLTSLERHPSKRQGKVYLDYLQNRHGQTLAAAYSVRPRPGATVSMPLHWDEVQKDLTPSQFALHNAKKRLDETGDLWQGVLGPGANLEAILRQLDDQGVKTSSNHS